MIFPQFGLFFFQRNQQRCGLSAAVFVRNSPRRRSAAFADKCQFTKRREAAIQRLRLLMRRIIAKKTLFDKFRIGKIVAYIAFRDPLSRINIPHSAFIITIFHEALVYIAFQHAHIFSRVVLHRFRRHSPKINVVYRTDSALSQDNVNTDDHSVPSRLSFFTLLFHPGITHFCLFCPPLVCFDLLCKNTRAVLFVPRFTQKTAESCKSALTRAGRGVINNTFGFFRTKKVGGDGTC